jgi:hypothetical protein
VDRLYEYLKGSDCWRLYKGTEFNHFLRFLYTALYAAARDNADSLVITRNGFKWYQGEELLGTHLGEGFPKPEPSYNDHLHLILKRDEIVASYISIEEENANETIVEIAKRE